MGKKTLLLNICYDYPVINEGIFSGINKIWQPLSLAYSASLLAKEDINVKLLDANALRIKPDDMGDYSKDFEMIIVSTTSNERWECPHLDIKPIIATCERIRQNNPDALIFLEGSHGTIRPLQMLELTAVNAVILGEAEFTIRDLALAVDWHTVEGIAYKENGRFILNPKRKPADLDGLPLPDFSQLPMEKYYSELMGWEFVVLETSRGCPFNCSYCLKEMVGIYRKKSFENFKKEILYCMDEFKVRRLNFLDLEFTVNRPLVEELCDWLIQDGINIEWSCQTRLNSVDEQLLRKMKSAGCKVVMYGVESASQRILDLIGKNITLDDIQRGMAATKRVGITSVCFFMFGLPSETHEERESTIKLALRLNPDFASFFICRPYPTTRCYEQVADRAVGLFPAGIGSEDELLELKAFCDKAFRRFYFRPNYILRRLLNGRLDVLLLQVKIFALKSGFRVL